MRTFLALPCPSPVREDLVEVREDLTSRMSIRTVPRENFHVTVKFLGQVTGSRLRDLDALLQRRLPTPGPLSLQLKQLGVFPDPERPRVVWAGVEPVEPLRELFEAVEAVATELGFDHESHDYRPHVTLGRFTGEVNEPDHLVRWLQEHGGDTFGSFEAPKLHLYESDTTGDGPPTYISRMSWPL